MNEKELIAVEVRWWAYAISHYVDKNWNKSSKIAKLPMKENELCKHWKIYEAEEYKPYYFRILSERDDKWASYR